MWEEMAESEYSNEGSEGMQWVGVGSKFDVDQYAVMTLAMIQRLPSASPTQDAEKLICMLAGIVQ